MKIISPRAHGALDYLTVAIFLLAPRPLGLTGGDAGSTGELLRAAGW